MSRFPAAVSDVMPSIVPPLMSAVVATSDEIVVTPLICVLPLLSVVTALLASDVPSVVTSK